MGNQFWKCTECETIRVWGDGPPEQPELLAQLNCDKCKDVTKHKFSHVGMLHETPHEIRESLPEPYKIEPIKSDTQKLEELRAERRAMRDMLREDKKA